MLSTGLNAAPRSKSMQVLIAPHVVSCLGKKTTGDKMGHNQTGECGGACSSKQQPFFFSCSSSFWRGLGPCTAAAQGMHPMKWNFHQPNGQGALVNIVGPSSRNYGGASRR